MSPKDFFIKYLNFQRKKKQEETDKSKPAAAPVKSTPNSIPDVVEQLQKRPVNRPKSTRPWSTYTSPQAANDGGTYLLGNPYGGSSTTGAHHDHGHKDGDHWGWSGVENGAGGSHHDSGGSSGDHSSGGCSSGDSGGGGGDCGGGGGGGGD
ncbi:hypothetical protein FVEN_g8726 [Fusarium venenatum]|uniref:Uncharacterized protein n=1 Tax=Fusarium venenatum TaxID=56646 RepID=A0A2L2T0N3_9HYPO|nr:uncharacterized protein FVRRES_12204 [Fusarium venenatum]KAG8353370.1 hypothetical protein FVEN_g8726 [Fusarium venenatum]CEI39513.1 unnamed protein product [Fusarium venenatum]